jgi:hypothetical protein
MTKTSKYATLDAVIVDEVRRASGRNGAWMARRHANQRIKAFAIVATEDSRAPTWYDVIGQRFQALRKAGKLTNNGVSGDGCRWFAAP